jgi:hypothetical protein
MLRRLATLDARQRTLVVRALVWVLTVRATLRAVGRSFPEQRCLLDWLAARGSRLPRCTVEEAAWAITAAARRVPGTRCLAWALALHGLLTQAEIGSEVRIGVAAPEPGTITAHAWVEAVGRSWSWGADVDGFSVLRPRAGAR